MGAVVEKLEKQFSNPTPMKDVQQQIFCLWMPLLGGDLHLLLSRNILPVIAVYILFINSKRCACFFFSIINKQTTRLSSVNDAKHFRIRLKALISFQMLAILLHLKVCIAIILFVFLRASSLIRSQSEWGFITHHPLVNVSMEKQQTWNVLSAFNACLLQIEKWRNGSSLRS